MTACKSTVSGSISLPSRGSFHLSLTVLVHYRSLGIFSLARWSAQIQSTFHEHRPTQVPSPYSSFSPTGLSPSSVQASTLVRLNSRFRLLKALQPPSLKERVWADPASLAATKGIDVSFFSSSYLDVSVRSVPFHINMDTRKRVGFPIRTSQSQCLLPARLGFSQVATSFVGSSARASTVDPYYLDNSSTPCTSKCTRGKGSSLFFLPF